MNIEFINNGKSAISFNSLKIGDVFTLMNDTIRIPYLVTYIDCSRSTITVFDLWKSQTRLWGAGSAVWSKTVTKYLPVIKLTEEN